MRRRAHRGRILAAVARLDKLPVWVSFPLGLIAGIVAGVAVMTPSLGPRTALLATLALGAALWLGLSAPRPVTPERPRQSGRTRRLRRETRADASPPERDVII